MFAICTHSRRERSAATISSMYRRPSKAPQYTNMHMHVCMLQPAMPAESSDGRGVGWVVVVNMNICICVCVRLCQARWGQNRQRDREREMGVSKIQQHGHVEGL